MAKSKYGRNRPGWAQVMAIVRYFLCYLQTKSGAVPEELQRLRDLALKDPNCWKTNLDISLLYL